MSRMSMPPAGRSRRRTIVAEGAGVAGDGLTDTGAVCHDCDRFQRRTVRMGAEARLKELNLTLPQPAAPMANYVGAVRTGSLLFVAGHGPIPHEGNGMTRGKLGRDLTTEEGYQVAREVGLNLLATVRANLGSLDRVKRIVKVLGMVRSA